MLSGEFWRNSATVSLLIHRGIVLKLIPLRKAIGRLPRKLHQTTGPIVNGIVSLQKFPKTQNGFGPQIVETMKSGVGNPSVG